MPDFVCQDHFIADCRRLKDYQEPDTEKNTGFVAPLRKRGRPKKELPPGSEPRRQRNQRVVCNTRFNSKTEM
ncbi:hypothetical protein TNCV_420441 [Trichonephila clavipes]|uniref:Uncharacterized protein n=1 Tax=Trichonephila clavipes TaxID=2585209 RepID=A0A8X6VG48_TRICX|nr:hypothetical protein TNCV_420441 [Trichonephila clavipes]